MKFLKWLKSLFTKVTVPQPRAIEPTIPQKPVEPPMTSTKGWQEYWGELIERLCLSNMDKFDKASDIEKIHPQWKQLSDDQKAIVLVEFFKHLIKFESAYDPLCESVDVGEKHDKQTWSVGLLQLSGVDKSNLGLPVGFDYEGLKNPENNIIQGIAIMVNQINKRGKIIIPKSEKGNPGVYWATLNTGNMYDKTDLILKEVHKINFVPPKPITDKPLWYQVAEKEIGVSETKNPKRVVEYHQATSLKAKDVKTPWCASFMSWVLTKSGLSSPKTAWARDFLKYGRKLDKPQKYCIMVFERGAPGGSSHVTLWTGVETERHYKCLGGNQGDAVNDSSWYLKQDLLGCRWPE